MLLPGGGGGGSRDLSLVAVACALLACGLASAEGDSQQPYRLVTVAEGLSWPRCLAFLPDGDLLVTERDGALRLVHDGALQSQPIAGMPPVYGWRGQNGLFDVVLHPDFAANRWLYLSYAHGNADWNALRIVRARLDGMQLGDLTPVFTTWPSKRNPWAFGGRMAFLPDGTLLLTIGDGFIYPEQAQRLGSSLGKVVRLNDDGSIPADNPFVGAEGRDEIWTYGHRNPYGLALAPGGADGPPIVYLHEHGPEGGDELNRLEPGRNYGWPRATFGVGYDGEMISPFTEYAGTEQPLLHWTPAIAPGGMAWYGGDLFPHWQGDLFIAALRARAIVRIDLENGHVVGQERLFEEIGERLRDVRVGPNGHMYILTAGSPQGRIIRVDPVL